MHQAGQGCIARNPVSKTQNAEGITAACDPSLLGVEVAGSGVHGEPQPCGLCETLSQEMRQKRESPSPQLVLRMCLFVDLLNSCLAVPLTLPPATGVRREAQATSCPDSL